MSGTERRMPDPQPAGPVPVEQPAGSPPPAGEGLDGQRMPEPVVMWAPPAPPAPYRGVGPWALTFAIAGLVASLFVGWAFPFSLVAIVTAAIALRRPVESRAIAGWALALGLAGLVYSAGWLVWAATRLNLFA